MPFLGLISDSMFSRDVAMDSILVRDKGKNGGKSLLILHGKIGTVLYRGASSC